MLWCVKVRGSISPASSGWLRAPQTRRSLLWAGATASIPPVFHSPWRPPGMNISPWNQF